MVPRVVSSTVTLSTPTPKGGPGGRVVVVKVEATRPRFVATSEDDRSPASASHVPAAPATSATASAPTTRRQRRRSCRRPASFPPPLGTATRSVCPSEVQLVLLAPDVED